MKLTKYQKAVGRCPKCKQYPTWFNDVPLRAFCYGPDEKPHSGMTIIVPPSANPYMKKDTEMPKKWSGWKTEAQYAKLMRG